MHSWVIVLVCPLTSREATRFVEGERRTYRKLDTADAETCRSAAVMCAECRLSPQTAGDMLTPCGGEPL